MDIPKENQQKDYEIGQRNLEQIIIKIDDKKTYEKALRQANKKYDLKNFKVLNMTPVKARKIYPILVEKYRQNLALQQSWLQNQRRLYIWIAICYMFHSQKSVIDLTFEEYSFFSKIFNLKNQNFLKFQIYAILKKSKDSSKWTVEEDNALKKVISLEKFDKEDIQWNEVSKQFFYFTGHRFFRSSKQCRQRWMNHLDPNKIKGQWTVEQDLLLLKFVKQNGKKWTLIVKELQKCKTQHMVKNRFNSLINKKRKQIRSKNQNKIISILIDQLESSEVKFKAQQFKTSQKEENSYLSNKSEHVKSQKNEDIQNIFENQSNLGNSKKYKFFVRKAGSLSLSQRGGVLPELANPILEEIDSEEQRTRQRFFISTPISERVGQIKSPYLMASPFIVANIDNITPTIFLLEQNNKANSNIYGSDFSMSCSSNFDKFVPQ